MLTFSGLNTALTESSSWLKPLILLIRSTCTGCPMNSAINAVSGSLYICLGVPVCSICPLFVTIISSATSIASSWSWVTNILVIPTFVIMSRSQLLNSCLTFASIAANGSSRSRSSGLGANALANATLCLCPPDNWLGYLFAMPESPTSSISSSTRFLMSDFFHLLTFNPNAMLSYTVMYLKSA